MKKTFAILAAAFLSLGAQAQISYITGLYKDKTATKIDEDTYLLTLDTWCNGTTIVEEKATSKNANVALVIDRSTSMAYHSNKDRGKLIGYIQSNGTVNTKSNGSGTTVTVDKSIYYSVEWGVTSNGTSQGSSSYQQDLIVRWNESQNRWEQYKAVSTATKTAGWVALSAGSGIYMCGFAAVCTATQRLLNNLAKDARTNSVDHKITIYSFCGSQTKELDTWTSVKTDSATIINTVLGMHLEGSTNPATALGYAVDKVGSATATTTANIVFFTDGDNSEQDNTIAKVKSPVKTTNGVKVFSIGYYFSDSDMSTTTRQFLEYVSSDYPNATKMSSPGTKTDSCYYKTTQDPMELIHYFDIVSLQIAKEAKTYTLDKLTQVRDTLTDEFILPTTGTSQISTYTIDCNGLDSDGNPTFDGVEDPITGLNITVGADKKSVEVHGFDFGANYCGTHYNTSTGAISVYGKKLRIKFEIKTTDEFQGGIDINTNTYYSGVYPTGTTSPATKFVSPKVCGPVDLIVTSKGINDIHENMIFRVTRRAADASADDTSFGHNGVYEIILTGPTGTALAADTIKNCAVKVDNDNDKATYNYTVETQAIDRDSRWDWRYDQVAADRKQTKPLHDGTNLDNVFPFTRTEKTDIPESREDVNTQIFMP